MRDFFLYWIWVFQTLRAEIAQNPYIRDEQTQWQRKLILISTTDGPIHTVWSWWLKIRYNWFTIGFTCWRRGHEYREQHIVTCSATDWGSVAGNPGTIAKFNKTGKTRTHSVSVCRKCGRYQGHSWKDK